MKKNHMFNFSLVKMSVFLTSFYYHAILILNPVIILRRVWVWNNALQ